MSFTNTVTLVAGGASGIGAGVVRKMAEQGSRVAIVDVNEALGTKLSEEIEQSGGEALFIPGDLTDPAFAERMVQTVESAYGRLDYLCNSAGKQTYGSVETTDWATWRETFSVNLDTAFLACKYAVPLMLRSGGGSIVNVSSVQAFRCQVNVSAYAASKAAVVGLTRTMALDYARRGIRVNCVCPGSVDTPLLREGAAQHGPLEEVLAEWGEHHPLGRIGTPGDIAGLISFLFSDDSAFLLGQAIVIDGGLGTKIL
jgi:NAD(P)-dependent dehydrogenase (short-subunit alcohol dehydrogenase family)